MASPAGGSVAKWMADRHFGFIARDSGGEIFFHQSDVVSDARKQEDRTMEPGLRVTFSEIVRD
eukprot:gene49038-22135_t